MSIPDAAIEAAAKAIHGATTREPKWVLTADAYKRFYRNEARAAIEAAMPAIREAIAQEIDAKKPHIPVSTHPKRRESIIVRATLNRAARIVRGGAA